ncbi:MAG: creatininase family protein [Chloroflexi bacterium]|nr:creatininase family protein [Chloroflexota bacterium]
MQFLAKMKYPEAKEAAQNPRAVVFVPAGTMEAHGPHLPLDTDRFGAEELSVASGEIIEQAGYSVIIAPAVPYGVCKVAMPFPGTVTLEPETLERVLTDICTSLAAHGFRKLVLLNHHGEAAHNAALGRAASSVHSTTDARVMFAFIGPHRQKSGGRFSLGGEELMLGAHPEFDWHAGEYETALTLSRRPGAVDPQLARGLPPVYVDLHHQWALGAKNFAEVPGGENCYFGDPSAATAETGERVFAERARIIAEKLLVELGAGEE